MRRSAARSAALGGQRVRSRRPGAPAGTECLADHVDAPPELLRRLRQVAVADEDKGQQLAVGQRLVTRDGRLRRWDGFVATGAGAAAAERLMRANRLAELADELPGVATKRSRRATAQRDRGARRDGAMSRGRGRSANAALAAERDAREAARAIDAAAAALERIEAQRAASSSGRRTSIRCSKRRAKRSRRPSASLAALPDPAALEQDVEAARGRAAKRRHGSRGQARRSRDQGARDGRRPRAVSAAGARAGGMAQAAGRCRAAPGRPPSSGRSSRPPNARELEQEPAELDARIARARAVPTTRARCGSAKRRRPSARPRKRRRRGARWCQPPMSAPPTPASAAPRAAARAEAQQARSAEFARASVEQVRVRPAATAREARLRCR